MLSLRSYACRPIMFTFGVHRIRAISMLRNMVCEGSKGTVNFFRSSSSQPHLVQSTFLFITVNIKLLTELCTGQGSCCIKDRESESEFSVHCSVCDRRQRDIEADVDQEDGLLSSRTAEDRTADGDVDGHADNSATSPPATPPPLQLGSKPEVCGPEVRCGGVEIDESI